MDLFLILLSVRPAIREKTSNVLIKEAACEFSAESLELEI